MISETTTEALATIRAAMGGDDRSIASACRLLNTVKLTVDQFNRGLKAYDDNPRGPDTEARSRGALEAFCEREGLLPSDVAAEAILIRHQPILEALHEARYDIKSENPALYADCVTRVIHQGYFRFLEANEIDADGNVTPLRF